MKRGFCILILLCLLCSSCGVKADFVISGTSSAEQLEKEEEARIFVLINKNSRKYHLNRDCIYAIRMSEENRLEIKVKNTEYLREHGYAPCLKCSADQ